MLSSKNLKFRALGASFKFLENLTSIKNLSAGYHGNCSTTKCIFSINFQNVNEKQLIFKWFKKLQILIRQNKFGRYSCLRILFPKSDYPTRVTCNYKISFLVLFRKVISYQVRVQNFWEKQVKKQSKMWKRPLVSRFVEGIFPLCPEALKHPCCTFSE